MQRRSATRLYKDTSLNEPEVPPSLVPCRAAEGPPLEGTGTEVEAALEVIEAPKTSTDVNDHERRVEWPVERPFPNHRALRGFKPLYLMVWIVGVYTEVWIEMARNGYKSTSK